MMKQRTMNYRSRILAALVLFGCIFLMSVSAWADATVTTDKDDYAPGERVIITGTGWEPGETVVLTIETDCGCTQYIFYTVADSEGNIYNDEFVILEEHLGVTFLLTAVGMSSGQVATTTFTDARQFTASITPTSACLGVATVYSITITNTSTAGEDMGCVRVTIPPGMGVTAGSLSVVATDPGPTTRTWSTPTISGSTIETTRTGGAANDIDPTGTVIITFTATATTTGSKTWTCSAFGGSNCSTSPFTITSSQPAVTINAAPTATVSGGGTICPGESATIQAALTGTGPWTIT